MIGGRRSAGRRWVRPVASGAARASPSGSRTGPPADDGGGGEPWSSPCRRSGEGGHAASGTMACVPMLALGKIVGVIHLESTSLNAFDPESVRVVTRVAENVGLAMANARLMKTMEGQAMSDPLTGLRNTRSFDPTSSRSSKRPAVTSSPRAWS
ncbi:MAG TPA: GAF domain-containing protein [Candidatus Limnocylindrales bacterium]|nr:GAF domain-containing protein [Candidatus Limnocylindrales bacterium]